MAGTVGQSRRPEEGGHPTPMQRFSAKRCIGDSASVKDATQGAFSRILDVGTGTGAGALWLAARFPQADVLGVDVSPEMIGRACTKADGRARFEVADTPVAPCDEKPARCAIEANRTSVRLPTLDRAWPQTAS